MARGIEIPLSINPSKLIRGIKLTEREFEKLEDSLEDVGDSGKQTGRKLEDVFKEAARDGDKSFDRLERSFDDNMRDMERRADRAGDRIGDDLRDGSRGSGNELGAEIGDEFVESWGEAVRAGNPAEAVSEVITNAGQIAASVLGPAGIVAGLGVAAIGGWVNSLVQGAREERERVAEAAASLGESISARLAEMGVATGKQYALAVQDGILTIEEEQEAIAEALNVPINDAALAVEQLAQEWNLSATVVKDAILGNAAAIEQVEVRAQQAAEARAAAEAALGVEYARQLDAKNQGVDYDDTTLRLLETQVDLLGAQVGEYDTILATAAANVTEADKAVAAAEARNRIWGDDVKQAELLYLTEQRTLAIDQEQVTAAEAATEQAELKRLKEQLATAQTQETRDALNAQIGAQQAVAVAAERAAGAAERQAFWVREVQANLAAIPSTIPVEVAVSIAKQDAALAGRGQGLP